jgi:Ca2+-binding EF-hand superfamily protein
MHKLVSLISIAATFAASAAFAGAAEQNPNYPQREPSTQPSGKMDHHKMAEAQEFASLDQNRDGRLSREEIPADNPVAAQFEKLDVNKDGGLSKREFAKYHE